MKPTLTAFSGDSSSSSYFNLIIKIIIKVKPEISATKYYIPCYSEQIKRTSRDKINDNDKVKRARNQKIRREKENWESGSRGKNHRFR